MPNVTPTRLLGDLALLYLAIAQSTGDDLSNAELDAITESLQRHYPSLDQMTVQGEVLDALAAYVDPDSLHTAAANAARTLRDLLLADEKEAVLEDLVRVARADGVILDRERGILISLAQTWGLDLPSEGLFSEEEHGDDEASWGALHHLAYIYLVLAHGTDNEFTDDERAIILKKLQEWQPSLEAARIQTILDRAMERYAHGQDADLLAASIEAVKHDLPDEQRKAALNDLVQIANADGVFLDSEEDLINELMLAWDVDAYANYGSHGSKSGS